MKLRQRILEWVIVLAIILLVGYIALPPRPSKAERMKAEQFIEPLDFENTEAIVVLQSIVDRAELPVTIGLCAEMYSRRVTIKTSHKKQMAEVLKEIGMQLGSEVSIYSGMHGELALPMFRFGTSDNRMIEIKRN